MCPSNTTHRVHTLISFVFRRHMCTNEMSAYAVCVSVCESHMLNFAQALTFDGAHTNRYRVNGLGSSNNILRVSTSKRNPGIHSLASAGVGRGSVFYFELVGWTPICVHTHETYLAFINR